MAGVTNAAPKKFRRRIFISTASARALASGAVGRKKKSRVLLERCRRYADRPHSDRQLSAPQSPGLDATGHAVWPRLFYGATSSERCGIRAEVGDQLLGLERCSDR